MKKSLNNQPFVKSNIILTEVSDSSWLIVITFFTFLKRKDMLKEKRRLAQIIKIHSPAYI